MDLDALRVFVKVAELSSFSRAAEQLATPKSRVSRRVSDLEALLGARLFQRSTRVVRLTAEGEQLLARARRLLVDADEIGAMFQSARALRGPVRVDLQMTLARDVVIPRLPELLAAHPQLEVLLSTTDRLVEPTREGFDCVLRVGPLGDSGLIARKLGDFAMVNCASPGYLRRYGVPQRVEDLDAHVLVNYSPTLGADAPAFEHHDGAGWRLRPMASSVTVNSADAYQAACLAGLGIIQAPAVGLRPNLVRGALVEVLSGHTARPMPVSLLHTHGRNAPRRVRAVMSWLAEVLAPHLRDGR